ncbi:hypothetical protein BDF22DRAFT_692100 [Syncephalis plumigaleata]|nr:hypothetical protein BDF22DRAFT_692100 [Syncephalis plumigaleata]
MYRSRFNRVARESVMSDDSIQSTLGNLDVLVQGDEEEWLYSPSKPNVKDNGSSAIDWLNTNDGTDSCYDTEGEGDDDLSLLLLSAARSHSLGREGTSGPDDEETGLLAPGGSNSLGLRLGGCPSPAPSSIWSISRPGSRMRGTPDLGELGSIVKNDGQMDDTDDLVTSPTIEFKGYDLENEAQWKNATDLSSPTKLNFNTNGPSALAQHLLRKNRSVADLKGTSGRNSPTRRLARPSLAGGSNGGGNNNATGPNSLRVNLTSRFHAAARDTSDGDAGSIATARSPLAQSHAISMDPDFNDDDVESIGSPVVAMKSTSKVDTDEESEDNNNHKLPSSKSLRNMNSGTLSANHEGTFSPASSSPTSSLIDPEEMNWQLDETVSITSHSSFHSMEGLASPGSKPLSSSITANPNSHGGFSLNHSSSSLSSLSVNSESSGIVTDAWLNSARKASAPPLPTLEDHRKISNNSGSGSGNGTGTGLKSLRSPKPTTESRQLAKPGYSNAKSGTTDKRPGLGRRVSSPLSRNPSTDSNMSDSLKGMTRGSTMPLPSASNNANGNNDSNGNKPLKELFAASRAAPSAPGAASKAPRRGHAPSKSGPVGMIRPQNPSKDSPSATGTSTPTEGTGNKPTLRARKSMAELSRAKNGGKPLTVDTSLSTSQRIPQRTSRLALPNSGASISRSRSASPVRQPPSPAATSPARRTMPAGALSPSNIAGPKGSSSNSTLTARRSLASPRSPTMADSKLASPSTPSFRRPTMESTLRQRDSTLPSSPSTPMSPSVKPLTKTVSAQDNRTSSLSSIASPTTPLAKTMSADVNQVDDDDDDESLDWIPGGIPGVTNNSSKRNKGLKKPLGKLLRLGRRSDSDDSSDDSDDDGGAVTGFFKQNIKSTTPKSNNNNNNSNSNNSGNQKSGSLLSRVASVARPRPPSLSFSKRTSMEVKSPPATQNDINPMESMGNINPLASKSRSVVSFLGKSSLTRRPTQIGDNATTGSSRLSMGLRRKTTEIERDPGPPTAIATRHSRMPSNGNNTVTSPSSALPRSAARSRVGVNDSISSGTGGITAAALRRRSAEYTGEPAGTHRLSMHSRRASGASFSSSTMSGQSSQRNSLVMSREPSTGSNGQSTRIRRLSQERIGASATGGNGGGQHLGSGSTSANGNSGLRSPSTPGSRTLRRSTTNVSRQSSAATTPGSPGGGIPSPGLRKTTAHHAHRLSNEMSGIPLSPKASTSGLRSPGIHSSNSNGSNGSATPSRTGSTRSIRGTTATSGLRRMPSTMMASPNGPSGKMEFI